MKEILTKVCAIIYSSIIWLYHTFKVKPIIPLLLIYFLTLNILNIDQKVRFVLLGENLKTVQREINLVKNENLKLQIEIAELASPTRVEQFACTNCNMILSDTKSRVDLVWYPDSSFSNDADIENSTSVWYALSKKIDKIVLPKDVLVERF